MLSTYMDYENWLFDKMVSMASRSPQLSDDNEGDDGELSLAIYEIGNDLMYGQTDWDQDDGHLSESWVFENCRGKEGEIILGGWNRLTGIELNINGVHDILQNWECCNREQIKLFVIFTLAHERHHREHGHKCEYHTLEEHNSHPNEIAAQRAGYDAAIQYLNNL